MSRLQGSDRVAFSARDSNREHDGAVTVVVLLGAVVSLLGVTAWIGLLIWAAKGDGRVQREHDRNAENDHRH